MTSQAMDITDDEMVGRRLRRSRIIIPTLWRLSRDASPYQKMIHRLLLSFLMIAFSLISISSVAEISTQSLRIVFFTDVHARAEWDTPKALELAAQAINAQEPDLIIGGGDYITEGFESAVADMEPRWNVYIPFHKALKAPVQTAIGNHDLVSAIPRDGSEPAVDPRAVYRSTFGLNSTYRSFESNGYHFILLDPVVVTPGSLKYVGRIDDEQVAWLKQDLSSVKTSTPIVVISHMPFVTDEYEDHQEPPANRVIVNGDEVLDLFKGHNLRAVLQGHLHVNERISRDGVTFITGGAICGQWWRGHWKGTPEGFHVLELKGDTIENRYVGYGWIARRPEDQ
jgi:Icc protein